MERGGGGGVRFVTMGVKSWFLSCDSNVLLPQGSVEAAAESRRCEAETAKLLAKEAAEIKKNLGEGGGKQRDVSQRHRVACMMASCLLSAHWLRLNAVGVCSRVA